MANVLCFDFDDTIVLENTARLLFERFGNDEWDQAGKDYDAGRLSVEQANAAALRTVTATREEMMAFVRDSVTIRPGFLELLDWCHWNDWVPIVISNGFDFYVDAILDGAGLDRLARHAARTQFDYRWLAVYLSPRGVEVQTDFKLSYAAAFQNMGDFVAYVGDGASDVSAAKLAQVVFARDTLLRELDGVHPRLYAFETFGDVQQVLEREASGWLESFSSTTAGAD